MDPKQEPEKPLSVSEQRIKQYLSKPISLNTESFDTELKEKVNQRNTLKYRWAHLHT